MGYYVIIVTMNSLKYNCPEVLSLGRIGRNTRKVLVLLSKFNSAVLLFFRKGKTNYQNKFSPFPNSFTHAGCFPGTYWKLRKDFDNLLCSKSSDDVVSSTCVCVGGGASSFLSSTNVPGQRYWQYLWLSIILYLPVRIPQPNASTRLNSQKVNSENCLRSKRKLLKNRNLRLQDMGF